MDVEITAEDKEKLKLLLSLVDSESHPNMNALNDIVRNVSLLSLNIKALGYELARNLASALPVSKNTSPRHITLKSKASTQADIESDWVAHWCAQLKIPLVYHRKLWEFAYMLQAIYQHGLIRPGARGLGFGCGVEPIPSYLASKGVSVTVTDLPPEDSHAKGWAASNEYAKNIEMAHQSHLVSREDFEKHVDFRYVDMNAIPSDLSGYDFCWSICALEHIGSIQKGLDFIANSLKTLRPGGIAIHTTEFNIVNDGPTIDNWITVLFQKRHFEQLADRLRREGHEVAELDFDLGNKPLDRFIDLPPWHYDMGNDMRNWVGQDAVHIKLAVDGFVCTCFGLIVRKAG